jgi:hypothetical protein
VDDIFCKILDFFDLEEHPILLCTHDGKTDTVLLLSPDAYAADEKTLEAKGLQPSTFMTQIADAFLTGPCILPYK